MNLDDTIVAIATPPGRGGIGVVRIAGPEARQIGLSLVRLKGELEPRRAVFGELVDTLSDCETAEVRKCKSESADSSTAEGGCATRATASEQRSPALNHEIEDRQPKTDGSSPDRIDEVVVTWFQKPHSYTTDDIVEISCHGSPVVLRHAVEIALAQGARLAEPGEFTMRAFLNGRIDLTQAEAVRDLIESQTLYQAKVAAQQLEGALANRLKPIKQSLVDLIALLEAGVDFAEDDVPVLPASEILPRLEAVRAPLRRLAESFAYGKVVHEGMTLAIVGRPNVGKSSLFNRLVERERAIVTATPGTTRDLVTETVAIGGIPVHLVDTAGIRSAVDEAESIGIRKSMEALADADLVLVVLDASEPLTEIDAELLRDTEARRAVVAQNKTDLARSQSQISANSHRVVPTSATTGQGIAELRAEILRQTAGDSGAQPEAGFLTNARHQALVRDSLAALDAGENAVRASLPHEMLLLDLYNALRPLDEITGATTADDILNLIFSRFCIGK